MMSGSALGAPERRQNTGRAREISPAGESARIVFASQEKTTGVTAEFSCVDLGDTTRVSVMLSPRGPGSLGEQAREVLTLLRSALARGPKRMTVTYQTVFLRDAAEQVECERLFKVHYGGEMPVTLYVLQPPCSGASLAMEVWAIGGDGVKLQRFGNQAVAINYDGVRWVHCASAAAREPSRSVYEQTLGALQQMRSLLQEAGSGFEHTVRTWFYLGNITGPEAGTQRYMEFNRARSDFYSGLRFSCSLTVPNIPQGIYPASTGIGVNGTDLTASCLTLQTARSDAFLLPLENPQQTPAYAYHPRYSPQSPKFSRAKALVLGGYVTTWISGTASVVNSETQHTGDIEKQTEQTIDNIEALIAPRNFAFHGVSGAGACLGDLAKIRVYLKRRGDLAKCKAICEQRFGQVPAIYAVADVCRPELLVEIEGVAFSKYSRPAPAATIAGQNSEAQK